MGKVTIDILPLSDSLTEASNHVVRILNNLQTAFTYSLLTSNELIHEISSEDHVKTQHLYPKFELLREKIGGHHPYIMGITDKRLANTEYKNLFGDVQTHHGIPLGNCVITTYQVQDLLKELPIEPYFIYQSIIYPLLVITRRELFHKETRICPFDTKHSKKIIYDVLKYSTLCFQCSQQIKKFLDNDQLTSMRSVFSTIDDLSNGKVQIQELLHAKSNPSSSQDRTGTYESINKSIVNGNLENALLSLIDLSESKDQSYINELIHLQSQLAGLRRRVRLNLLDISDSTVELNRIKQHILDLNDEIHHV